MHDLASDEVPSGLTRSIISPLGRLGMDGKEFNTFLELTAGVFSDTSGLLTFKGGDILSCFFLTDCLVFGGDTGVRRKVLRFLFCGENRAFHKTKY